MLAHKETPSHEARSFSIIAALWRDRLRCAIRPVNRMTSNAKRITPPHTGRSASKRSRASVTVATLVNGIQSSQILPLLSGAPLLGLEQVQQDSRHLLLVRAPEYCAVFHPKCRVLVKVEDGYQRGERIGGERGREHLQQMGTDFFRQTVL